MAKVTKKGALEVTQALDRVANLFQADFESLGVPKKFAHDFALRCDMMADHIERTAAASNGGWDPKQIGEEVSGPEESNSDESAYMGGEFTQQENSELREDQEAGKLPKGVPEEQSASPGQKAKQAAELRRHLQAAVLSGASARKIQALALAAQVAEEEEEGDEEGKKAGEVPEAFKKNWDKGEGEEEKKEEGKKASHGFNLSA